MKNLLLLSLLVMIASCSVAEQAVFLKLVEGKTLYDTAEPPQKFADFSSDGKQILSTDNKTVFDIQYVKSIHEAVYKTTQDVPSPIIAIVYNGENSKFYTDSNFSEPAGGVPIQIK
ncbi:MAG: hypothetical protein ACRCTQ_07160 [Brevinemataceae bacterium]